MIRRPITFVGMCDGHFEVGEISAHEIDEFVESCQSAGWDSIVIARGARILRKWRRDG